ncbi:MAG: APC family permease [Halobacteriota archaeon]
MVMVGTRAIGLGAAISIGVGAMVGAGIFSILGVAGSIAGNALYISFIISGVMALIIAYSYAKLSLRYPSAGGPTEFLVKGFGDGATSGGFNLLLWISYIFGLALYSRAFGSYATTFLPAGVSNLWVNFFATLIILIFTAVNFIGARAVGSAEKYIVAIKVGILLTFVVIGLFFIQPNLLAVSNWPSVSNIFFASAIVFLAYQGFSLITNAAEDMDTPQVTMPRALYLSIILVIIIYVGVSVMVLGNLPISDIISAKDYAMAQATTPFLGALGFKIVAIAALLSTASGINATLYGGANISYILAKEGHLPAIFERKVWQRSTEGLFITAGLTIMFANFLDLAAIAMVGSASILLIYVTVNVAHLKLLKETGARRAPIWAAIVLSLAFFVTLMFYEVQHSLTTVITLVIVVLLSFIIEWSYRAHTKRPMETRTA